MAIGHTTTVSVSRSADPLARRRREVALHLARGWCPVNQQIRKEALQLIEDPAEPRSRVVNLLMQDPGLFTLVLRNLGKLVPEQDRIDPIQTLLTLELHQLKALLLTPERQQSRHKLNNASAKQFSETRHCAVAVQAARELGTQTKFNADRIALRTYFSEMIYLLAAWNYPVQYALALTRQKKRQSSLAKELEELLGIELSTVFNQYLKDWRISIDQQLPAPESDNDSKNEMFLSKLAVVWSRSRDQELFPESAAELSVLNERAVGLLPDGWQNSLEIGCAEVIKKYDTYEPFKVNSIDDQSEQHFTQVSPLFKRLTVGQQEVLKPVVRNIVDGQVREALLNLANSSIPALGFKDGCLFIKSDQKNELMPVVRFGPTPLSRYQAQVFEDKSELEELVDSSIPFKNTGVGITGNFGDYVVSGFKNPGAGALLYLEYSDQVDNSGQPVSHLTFRCVRDLLELIMQQLVQSKS